MTQRRGTPSGPTPLLCTIVAVAGLVGADQPAPQRRIDAVRPGVAAPPAEDLAENAHAVRLAPGARAVARYGIARAAMSMLPSAAAELPQPAESGIALGYQTVAWWTIFAPRSTRGTAAPPTRRKSRSHGPSRASHPQLLPRVGPTTTSSRWVRPTPTRPRDDCLRIVIVCSHGRRPSGWAALQKRPAAAATCRVIGRRLAARRRRRAPQRAGCCVSVRRSGHLVLASRHCVRPCRASWRRRS